MIDQETLFWIYILYPVITGDVQSPNQYFLEQCSKSHKLPNGDAKQISMSTCITKYISYTERGIDGLSRKRRNDIGHPRTITNGILDDILNNVLLNPHLPLKEVCKEVTAKYGIVIPKSTFYGYIRKARIAGLIPKKGNPRSVNNIDLTVVKHKLNEMIVDDLPLRDIYHGIPHLSPNDHGCDMFHENIIVHLNNAWLNGSMHMKKRILSIVLYGYDYNISEIEKIICLSKSTIRRAINSFERHGDVGRAKRTENAA